MVGHEFHTAIGMISRMSFQSKTYQSQWKVRKVKTVDKKGKKDDCGNYRPLSMLSISSRITESAICDELDKHLQTVLLDIQWGYRKGKPSETMLLYLSETWKRNIDSGKVVGVILIDFRKAFDTVNHNILHQKMKNCGLKGTLLEWLKSYLTDRSQYVELNGKKSKVTIIEYGVPQGSLLGPRLFLVYVNDMSGCVTVGELHLYADDTTAL